MLSENLSSPRCLSPSSSLRVGHTIPKLKCIDSGARHTSKRLSIFASNAFKQRAFGTRNPVSCSVLRDLLSGVVASSIGITLVFWPTVALADPPMPAATTEAPAAVNAVNTEENAQLQQDRATKNEETEKAKTPSRGDTVSLDLSKDGQRLGRVAVSVYKEPPLGSQRFLQLARRNAGGYRLSRVDGISDSFVTFSGILQQNYTGLPELVGGETVEQLEAEQSVYQRSHDRKGLVSLIIEDAGPKDVRERLVAYQGKLITVQEVKGASNANGTGFAVTLGATPLLDKTNLVVGEVVDGLDVIERIAKLPRVKSSSSSPFFKIAKALGDRRADVAAKSFGKPLGKIIIDAIHVEAVQT